MTVITIGKAPDNDYVVNHPQVSRHHARLVSDEQGCWFLEDLDSSNGTFVNEKRLPKLTKIPVHSADKITFADIIFEVKNAN